MKWRTIFVAVAVAVLLGIPFADAQNDGSAGSEVGREIDPEHVRVPDGYRIEAVVANLTVPTTAVFDGDDLLIAESGFNRAGVPRIVRVAKDGTSSVVVDKGLEAPV